MMAEGTSVSVEGLTAGYGRGHILESITLSIDPGELVCLLGPSGCGKSTLLRVMAGLHPPETGEIRIAGRVVNGLTAERRRLAMVFQRPLLFPWLSVAENIGFGLKMQKVAKEQIRRKVSEALQMVQLEGYADRRPSELSGGQAQRVALARALVTTPDLLLLDEPFSALDENLRGEMRHLVRRLQRELCITTIFVTHDQTEAALLADRIALLLDGRLAQFDPPRQFFTAPKSPEVARFFGWQLVESPGGTIALRPELVRLRSPIDRTDYQSGPQLLGTLRTVTDLGLRIAYTVELDTGLMIEISGEEPALPIAAPGARVQLDFPPRAIVYFDEL
jgi:ABC-type Fe3+/spermidine/putrescine transport system ATPase subunit